MPPEPSFCRGLLVCYWVELDGVFSVGRGFPRAPSCAYAFSDVRSQRHRSKPTSRTCRRAARGPWRPTAKRPKTAVTSRVPRGPNPGEDHHTPAARREGKAYGSPGRRRGKPQPTATPTRAGTLRARRAHRALRRAPRRRRDPSKAFRRRETRRATTHNYNGRRRHKIRHQPTARRPAPS